MNNSNPVIKGWEKKNPYKYYKCSKLQFKVNSLIKIQIPARH